MKSFVYHNPTRIVFGEGTIEKIGEEVAPFAKKVLLIYGMGSVKRNGVFDKVLTSLRSAGVQVIEYGGIKANPTLSHTRQGIALAKREQVDAVVAVGGGSVIDEGKAIAAGSVSKADVWEFYNRSGTKIEAALPLFTVLTMSATGTEMNGGTVITNEETNQKLGMGSPFLYPKTSILDPSTLVSVPADQSAYGAVDAVTHLLESYFTKEDSFSPIQDRYVEGIVRTITEIAKTMQTEPHNIAIRATFMWAATLAWNGMAPSGVGVWSTPNHLIGHSMSALFDTPHGASLSIALSGWMPWYAEQSEEHAAVLAGLGRSVFDVDLSGQKTARENASATIDRFRAWFRSIGCPTSISDIGVDKSGLVRVARNIGENAPLWGLPDYTAEFCEKILN